MDNTTSNFAICDWTFCAAAIVVTGGRFYLRWRRFRTVKWDDFFNGLALLCLVGFSATVYMNFYYYGPGSGPSLALADNLLLWSTLYCVKASFLALIYEIFSISDIFRKAWLIITIYTFLSFWPIFFSELWVCGKPSDILNYDACVANSDLDNQALVDALWFKFILHLTSDCLILVLPLTQLRKMHMPTIKKISIAAVFALIIVDIICGILRNVSIICLIYTPGEGDTSLSGTCNEYTWIMASAEPSIAVIVCALPVYRTLLPGSSGSRYERRAGMVQQHEMNLGGAAHRKFRPIRSLEEGTESSTITEPESAHLPLGTEVPNATISWPLR